MTLEQAKALVPEKDYVIYENKIYQVWRWNNQKTCLEIKSKDSTRRIILAGPQGCQTLEEYKGGFGLETIPPPKNELVSIDVIGVLKVRDQLLEEEIVSTEVIHYNFIHGEWIFNDYTVFLLDAKWFFIPEHIKL